MSGTAPAEIAKCRPLAVGEQIAVFCVCGHLRMIHRLDGECPSCLLVDHIRRVDATP